MKYNWKKIDTTEGSARLKELLDSGFAVLTIERGGAVNGQPIQVSSKHPDGVYNIHDGRCFPNSEEWDSIMGSVYRNGLYLEFLDPRPDLPELKWGPYDVGEETTTEGIFTYYTKQDYFQVFLQGKLVEFNDELEDGKAALDEWRREQFFAAFC